IEVLTTEQIAAVLAKLAGHALYPIVALALATGMRRGELLALQWGDVDLDASTLRVERSVEETRAGLRLKPPKTKRGRRNIALPTERRWPCCAPTKCSRWNCASLLAWAGPMQRHRCSLTSRGG